MTHLDEETLQRVLDRELDPSAAADADAHLAACETCARRLAEAEREERRVLELLGALDHEPPRVDPESIADRAAPGPRWRPLLAATVAFLVVGALAWAIPGSPVPGWVRSVAGSGEAGPTAPDEPPVAGISVEPGDSLEVVFEHAQEAGAIRVAITPSGELDLRVRGPAPGVRVEPHRVVVGNAGSAASYEIAVPESAPLVRIRVGPDVVLVKEGPIVRTDAPAGPTGAWEIPLAP